MELIFCNSASIRLFVIFLISLCLRVSDALDETETATTDEDFTKPEVTIIQGSLRGVTISTLKNRTISGFLGIPFAEPPIGNLRFRAPVPAGPWNETLNADSDTPDCLQLSEGVVSGNEDCLYVNVYTPRLPTDELPNLLPVMMYIHGGGYYMGGNNVTILGPEYLLDKDVVLVVPSYRLGIFGFLSTGDAEAPGNWGLKDQILALKWMHDNIEYFGGDPNQVTILGESAGSMSVNYLALTNSTKGLFHRYILQSSSALSTMTFQPRATAIEYTSKLGQHLGCDIDTSAALIECLRASDALEIINTTPLYIKWGEYPIITAAPTIEPDLPGAVLTDTPENLIATGQLHDLPCMVGSIPGDGIVLSGYLYANPDKIDEFLEKFDYIVPYILNYDDKVENVSAYSNALKSYYFNNGLTTDKSMVLSNFTQLCTDLLVKFPNYQELQKSSTTNTKYLYSFEYRGTYSYSYIWTSGLTEDYGVVHCDELLYLFPQSKSLFGESASMSETDLEMVETMVELWTSFAITGKPESTALASNEFWPPYSEQMDSYLLIGNGSDVSLQVIDSNTENEMQFYRSLPEIFG